MDVSKHRIMDEAKLVKKINKAIILAAGRGSSFQMFLRKTQALT